MDTAVYSLAYIILLFSLLAISIDIFNVEVIRQNIYQNVRSANQNSLLELKAEREKGKTADSKEMIDLWIENYCLSTSNTLNKVDIEFIKVDNDPPFYLVRIKGYGKYLEISERLYGEVISGAVLIENE